MSGETHRDRAAGSATGATAGRASFARGLGCAAAVGVVAVGAALFGWHAAGRLSLGDGAVVGIEARVLGWMLSQRADRLRAPAQDTTPIDFEISPGEDVPSVAARLAAAGLVRDADTFRLLARVRGLDRGIQAGHFTLRRDMSAEVVLDALQRGASAATRVTVPEGLRLEEIALLLASHGIVAREAFVSAAGAQGAAERAAIDGMPDGATLEGFLFPDTYDLAPATDARIVVERMLDAFEARLAGDRRAAVAASGRSLFEIVTLASIVEREAVLAAERGRIARVYLNRLAAPPYILNADPTVQYALGFQAETDSWWKRPLGAEDLQVASPYNSYSNAGLPPGPICSPGLAAIDAVLHAPEGDWQYFVANDLACDGSHVFAATFEQHLENVAVYQRGGCGR